MPAEWTQLTGKDLNTIWKIGLGNFSDFSGKAKQKKLEVKHKKVDST